MAQRVGWSISSPFCNFNVGPFCTTRLPIHEGSVLEDCSGMGVKSAGIGWVLAAATVGVRTGIGAAGACCVGRSEMTTAVATAIIQTFNTPIVIQSGMETPGLLACEGGSVAVVTIAGTGSPIGRAGTSKI